MSSKASKSKKLPDHDLLDSAAFRSLFYFSPERKIVFKANDPDYTFVAVTDSHLELTGMTREQIVGRNFFELFPDVSDEFKKTGVSPLAEMFRKIIKDKQVSSEVMRYDIPDGKGNFIERYWKVTHYPILNADGKVEYILQSSNNVTAEVTAEREMREMREQLEDALQIGKVGSWVWDIGRDVVVADANLAKMFGITKNAAAKGIPLSDFTTAIHPEDREQIQKAIQAAIKKNGSFEEEYRTVDARGRIRWVLARGRVEKRGAQVMFPGVIVDITERRDLQAQVELARKQDILNRQAAKMLQERNDELEAISRTKDEFVALASHQLRTPATAVKQYLGMVLQGYVGEISEVQTEMLGKAFESNERQIQIINQILNAARVDTGRLVMTPVPLDLRSMLEGISRDMESQLAQHKHTFTVKLPKTPVQVVADLGYLRMAIENLLHNASIYTPDGGKITMVLTKVGKQCRLSISDTGVGIKKADMSKLFVKFSRIHNPLSVQAGGSGIGLYLTAEIIRLHGGSVTVDSKINKGTTFAISLPLVA